MERNKKGQFIKGHKDIISKEGRKKAGKKTSKSLKELYRSGKAPCGFKKGEKKSKKTKIKMAKSKIGKKNPSYKNGKFKTKSGHILVLKPKHPLCNTNGYIYEHRLVMEKKIGRYLKVYEQVHHIDGNSSNNNISNLFLTTLVGNIRAHSSVNKLLEGLLKDKIIKFNKKIGQYERN